MIEVEKKFQPTEEQLVKLLEGAEFVKEKKMHDMYYDFPDYRLFKSGKRLRKRNDGFELKIYHSVDETKARVADEFETEIEIKEKLNLPVDSNLSGITERDMLVVCDFNTIRNEYKKDGFIIDVDQMDFGVNLVEIETIVANNHEINEAGDKIIEFAQRFDIEEKSLPLKTGLYLKIKKPEVYKEIFEK